MKLSIRKLSLEFRNIRKIVMLSIPSKLNMLCLLNSDFTCSSISYTENFLRERVSSAYISSQKRDEMGKTQWQLKTGALSNEKTCKDQLDPNSSCSSQVSPTGNAPICAAYTTLPACGNGERCKIGIVF